MFFCGVLAFTGSLADCAPVGTQFSQRFPACRWAVRMGALFAGSGKIYRARGYYVYRFSLGLQTPKVVRKM